MAVIEYKEGDHPSGYIGFRVDTTIAGERYQEYFSLRFIPYKIAKRRAHELNERWLSVQKEHNDIDRLMNTKK